MRPLLHGLSTGPWLPLLLIGLSGCQAAPALLQPPTVAPVAPSPPIIRLCGQEIPAEQDAVRAEVLRHVSPGLPVETACSRLEELGFTCLYSGFARKKPESYHPMRSLPELIWGRDEQKDKSFHTLLCTITPNEIDTWGQRYFPIAVQLPYDENGLVTEVAVPAFSPITSHYAHFFAQRPELRVPIGLSVEHAQSLMQAHQFHCDPSGPVGPDHRPYLNCYAFEEGLLSGRIIRVHLFYDENKTVTEATIVQQPGEWDGLRCILPNESDTVTSGTAKAVVFPVRLYASLVIAGIIADLRLNN